MAGDRKIQIKITGDATGLKQAAGEAERATGKFSARTQKMATAGLAGAAAIGGALVAGLAAGVKGLQEGEEAEARFTQALRNVPKQVAINEEAFKGYAEAIQKNTRFTYEDALAAGSLLAAQDGVQAAIKAGTTTLEASTSIVLDWATAAGIDASAAAKAYAKAMAAPEKAAAGLRKAGVNLTEQQQDQIKAFVAAGDIASAQAIIQGELAEKFKGSAEAAGQTTAGQMERARNAFGEVQEQLAVGLMPTLTDLLGQLVKVTAWAQENPGKVKLVVGVLAALAAVVGTVSAVVKVWTAIQTIHNAVLAANPIVLVTLAIVALVAIVVVIATKTTWFQQIWKAAWGAITGAVQGAFSWIKSNWPLILAVLTGPVGLAVAAIVKHKDRIIDVVGEIPTTAKRLFSGLGETLASPFRAAVEALRSAWNSTLGGKGWDKVEIPLAPDVPGFRIPMLAEGGTARAGRLHLVGERGPELFVPGRTGQVVPNDALGGSPNFTIELHGEGLESVVQRVVVRRESSTRNAVRAGSRRVA